MKVLRKIVGKQKQIRCQQIRESFGIQNINEWEERREREWDQHVTRMDAERLVKISRHSTPFGRRSSARPKNDGTTKSLIETGGVAYREEEEIRTQQLTEPSRLPFDCWLHVHMSVDKDER